MVGVSPRRGWGPQEKEPLSSHPATPACRLLLLQSGGGEQREGGVVVGNTRKHRRNVTHCTAQHGDTTKTHTHLAACPHMQHRLQVVCVCVCVFVCVCVRVFLGLCGSRPGIQRREETERRCRTVGAEARSGRLIHLKSVWLCV